MRPKKLTIIHGRLRIRYDTRHFGGQSVELVQAGKPVTAKFYENAADHSSEAPAASMMASISSRNTLGSRCSTKRLAMKAPSISEEPAIRPLRKTSGVSAPKRSKVTDLLT